MKDAPPAKQSKSAESAEKKPRFEVKKVLALYNTSPLTILLTNLSGMQSPSGPGTSWSKHAPSVETTSWSCASNVRRIRLLLPLRNALLLGAFAMYVVFVWS